MPEKVVPGPICEERSIREAVCIHTKKIFDSCKDEDIAPYRISVERSPLNMRSNWREKSVGLVFLGL